MFSKILEKAYESRENNRIKHKEALRLEEERKAIEESEKLLKNITRYKNVDYRKNNCSSELLKLIDECEFEILSYEKNLENHLKDDCLLEVYRCKKNNWTFEINNLYDCAIRENIFATSNLKNTLTGKNVSFKWNLNRGSKRNYDLDLLLKLLNVNSEKQCVKEVYKSYFNIPNMLISRGLKCFVLKEDYTLKNCGFICRIDYSSSHLYKENDKITSLYLKFKHSFEEDNSIYISKDENELDLFQIYSEINVETRYCFEYKSEEDIDELIRCLTCFYEQSNNRMGYLENGKYYSNYHVFEYFNLIMDNERILDKKHSNLIRIKDTFGGIDYGANKYEGREIFVSKNIIINDAGYYSEGDEINHSLMVIKYDTKKDAKSCILSIKNYIYKNTDSIYYRDIENDFYVFNLRPEFMVDELEIKGSFSYVMSCLDEYVKNIFNIYEILI